MKIKAVCISRPGEIEVHWLDYPSKKPHDILLNIEGAGICSSDIGAFRVTNRLVGYPRLIGHDVAGIIIKQGNGIPEHSKEGDRVIIQSDIYWGHCYPCAVNSTNCGKDRNAIGMPIDGAITVQYCDIKIPQGAFIDDQLLARRFHRR